MTITNKEQAQEALKELKVGQKVRIKDDISVAYVSTVRDMQKYQGKISTIVAIDNISVRLECCGMWSWSPDMFDVIEVSKEVKKEVKKDVVYNGKLIKKVIFNDDVTIVLFSDGTKTVTKRLADEEDNKEHALAMALVKSVYGKNYFKDIFERFLPATETEIKPLQKGDLVRIKSWEQMEQEFEVDDEGDILVKKVTGKVYFNATDRKLCGNIITVKSVDDSIGEIYFEEECDSEYTYVSIFEEMVERI